MMSKPFEKVFKVMNHLEQKGRATPSELMKIIGNGENCSRHTLYRTLKLMKEVLKAKVKYDVRAKMYYLESFEDKKVFRGLSFKESDLLVLISLLQIIKELDFLIDEDLKNKLLYRCGKEVAEVHSFLSKIKVIPTHHRIINIEIFKVICEALKRNKRLWIKYDDRTSRTITYRDVSPIHLVRYKDNWYLDAYCHKRDKIRIFSVDRIRKVEILNQEAEKIDEEQIREFFESSYGIFTGTPKDVAVLHFSPRIARWVAEEEWHPDQKIKNVEDGSCIIEIPYSDERELVMDILKYGEDVRVLHPESLRNIVKTKLQNALKYYSSRRQ